MALKNMDLKHKVAFITGAAGGIGYCCAKALAQQGCHIILTDLNEEGLENAAQDIRQLGCEAETFVLDVSDFDAFKEVAKQAASWKGHVDILINNAGIMIGGGIGETDIAMLHKVSDVNTFGPINGIKAFYDHMIARKSGHVVNISSLFGLMHLPYVSAYCMTKASIVGLSNALRGELAPFGINVTLVCPGSVDTGLISNGHWTQSKGGEFIPGQFVKGFKSSPEKIADQVVAGIKKNKSTVMAGADAKILSRMIRFIPWMFEMSFKKLGKELAQ